MFAVVFIVVLVASAAAAFVLITGDSTWSSDRQERGSTRIVPDDFPTIQAAVDAAERGDIILVRPGRYRENVDLSAKAVRLSSEDPQCEHTVSRTIIDAGEQGPALLFHRPPDSGWTVVEGFTLTNGSGYLINRSSVLGNAARAGGGVYIGDRCSPLIRHNHIAQNCADMGGGIYVWGSSCASLNQNVIEANRAVLGGGLRTGWDFAGTGKREPVTSGPTGRDRLEVSGCNFVRNRARFGGAISVSRDGSGYFTNNEIANNTARWDGGGMSIWDGSRPEVKGNEFNSNSCGCDADYGYGGGISVVKNCRPAIIENRLVGNRAGGRVDSGGGGISVYSSAPQITDNELQANSASRGSEIFAWSNSDAEMKGNRVSRGGVVIQ